MPSSSSHGGWKGGNIAKEYRIFLLDLPPTGYVKQPTFHGPGDASNLALKHAAKQAARTIDKINVYECVTRENFTNALIDVLMLKSTKAGFMFKELTYLCL